MQLEFEAKKLVNYINSVGLNIPPRKPSHKHVGAIIADAVLQSGRHGYSAQVERRVERIQDKYPSAATISGLSYLLKTEGAQELLNWSGKDEQGRFCQTVSFFENEGVNTFDDLRKWLESEANRARLITKSNRVDKAGIAEISDATADYYRVLVRLPNAVKIDRRVESFLKGAGIRIGIYEYKDLQTIVQLAAKQLNTIPSDLDAAIWGFQGLGNGEGGQMTKSRPAIKEDYVYEFAAANGLPNLRKIIEEMKQPQGFNAAKFRHARKGEIVCMLEAQLGPSWISHLEQYEWKGKPHGQIHRGWLPEYERRRKEFEDTPEGKQWLKIIARGNEVVVGLSKEQKGKIQKLAVEWAIDESAAARILISLSLRQTCDRTQ
jgi:hypothetical protein